MLFYPKINIYLTWLKGVKWWIWVQARRGQISSADIAVYRVFDKISKYQILHWCIAIRIQNKPVTILAQLVIEVARKTIEKHIKLCVFMLEAFVRSTSLKCSLPIVSCYMGNNLLSTYQRYTPPPLQAPLPTLTQSFGPTLEDSACINSQICNWLKESHDIAWVCD